MLKTKQACQLLEPWYAFRLLVPNEQVGRALNDIQQMNGTFALAEPTDTMQLITGTAPVATLRDYATTVRSYTHGQGSIELTLAGYQPCHNADEIITATNYNPTADLANTPDSVFCAHGAGYPVKWIKFRPRRMFPTNIQLHNKRLDQFWGIKPFILCPCFWSTWH